MGGRASFPNTGWVRGGRTQQQGGAERRPVHWPADEAVGEPGEEEERGGCEIPS